MLPQQGDLIEQQYARLMQQLVSEASAFAETADNPSFSVALATRSAFASLPQQADLIEQQYARLMQQIGSAPASEAPEFASEVTGAISISLSDRLGRRIACGLADRFRFAQSYHLVGLAASSLIRAHGRDL